MCEVQFRDCFSQGAGLGVRYVVDEEVGVICSCGECGRCGQGEGFGGEG